MSPIQCEIVVVGAGVLGLSVAAELTTRGHAVRVVDPGTANASAVAAGMIAPAFESLLDGADADRAALLRDAALLWPGFAARTGIKLDRTPAQWCGPDADEVAERLAALGFAVGIGAVSAASDMRVDAAESLLGIKAGLAVSVIVEEAVAVERVAEGWRLQTTAGGILASHVVIATGVAGALDGLPREVVAIIDAVQPIAGQIGRVSERLTDRVLRGREGYVAPVEGGALIGASMAFGSRSLHPDQAASKRLVEAAGQLLGGEVAREIEWRTGVRGATADGLPLAGPVGGGLHLALAPRRNGWLMGPLVGRVVADGIEGRPRGPHAAALDPLRSTLPVG